MEIEQVSLNRAKLISKGIKGDKVKTRKTIVATIDGLQIVFFYNPKFSSPGFRFKAHIKESCFDYTFEFGPEFLTEVTNELYI